MTLLHGGLDEEIYMKKPEGFIVLEKENFMSLEEICIWPYTSTVTMV